MLVKDDRIYMAHDTRGDTREGTSRGVHLCDSVIPKEISGDWSEQLSQATSYSLGEDDISPLIEMMDIPTQSSEEKPPDSKTPSIVSLGKRKASELSFNGSTDSKPHKFARRSFVSDSDNNPFLVGTSSPAEELKKPPEDMINLSPSHYLQKNFDTRQLPYGVQYEIARLVNKKYLRYEEIKMSDLDKISLLGPNEQAAPETAKILLNYTAEHDEAKYKVLFAKEIASSLPWAELDREESAFQRNSLGGLGFDSEGNRLLWYGGQVHFRLTLKDKTPKEKTAQYEVKIERVELGTSNQFARRFGSQAILRLKLPKATSNRSSEDLLQYLCKPFIVCSRVYRAFYAKDSTVFLIRTNEVYDGVLVKISSSTTHPSELSFHEFIEKYNAPCWNLRQTMAKWSSRFALALSNSVPGLLLEPSQIIFEKDIGEATGCDMTDGAGTINRAGLRELYHYFKWEDWPTSIQARILGSKGLLVEDKKDTRDIPYIRIRPSQIKINYPRHEKHDASHLIIDVLRPSHTKSPCRLSVETIINLAENGVPKSAFIQLLQRGLDEIINPLLTWKGPNAMAALICSVMRIGGVMAARRAREEVGSARVKGHSERIVETKNFGDDTKKDADILNQLPSAWWDDETSGCPSNLEESIICLLFAGFTPNHCALLRSKLEAMVKNVINNYFKNYRIDVPMSATAFLVPDELGILEPGEVFFKSSKRNLKTRDGAETDLVVGEVLLTRHPCKLPTDVQKWRAVDRIELHYLTDVIVLSTKGRRRAADYLAGGDYDGDKGMIIFQPELVDPFKNASEHYSEPPSDINENFSKHNETVGDFIDRTKHMTDSDKIREHQRHLLGAVKDTSVVGKYSTFHENAVYLLGYTHPETIRLAYMFCMTLDGAKTGLTVLPEILKNDTRNYQKRPPLWKETIEDVEWANQNCQNEVHLTRGKNLHIFIMDILYREAEVEGKRRISNMESFFSDWCYAADKTLTDPWNEALALAERLIKDARTDYYRKELERIMAHVHATYNKYREVFLVFSPRKLMGQPMTPKHKEKSALSEMPIEVRQEKIRTISRQFASFSSTVISKEDVAKLLASYAFCYDTEQRKGRLHEWTRFPWDVAMRELCAIKCRAHGSYVTMLSEFYSYANLKAPDRLCSRS